MFRRQSSTSLVAPPAEPEQGRIYSCNQTNANDVISQLLRDSRIRGLRKIALPFLDNVHLGQYGYHVWSAPHCIDLSVSGLPASIVRNPEANPVHPSYDVWIEGCRYGWNEAIAKLQQLFDGAE